MNTLARVTVGAVAVLALATGCSDDNSIGATASSAIDSVTAQLPTRASEQQAPEQQAPQQEASSDEPSTEQEVTPVSEPVDPLPSDQGDACLDPSSAVVQNALASVGTAPRGDAFVPGQSSVGTKPNCPELEWIMASTPGATGSSPENLMLFHDGKFVQLGTPKPSAFGYVTGSTDDSVTVHYSWLVGDEPNCCPQGNADVTFTWDGSGVVSDIPVPDKAWNFHE
ncbi:LppP/LprE family lipoprotein [Antrihabitans cavernicola]|nr:LppP/LprE family lipoprotein [Spelaeibacter cavernicola]